MSGQAKADVNLSRVQFLEADNQALQLEISAVRRQNDALRTRNMELERALSALQAQTYAQGERPSTPSPAMNGGVHGEQFIPDRVLLIPVLTAENEATTVPQSPRRPGKQIPRPQTPVTHVVHHLRSPSTSCSSASDDDGYASASVDMPPSVKATAPTLVLRLPRVQGSRVPDVDKALVAIGLLDGERYNTPGAVATFLSRMYVTFQDFIVWAY